MNIKQIKGFVELAKTLNFTRTAEKMYMSQPAFSRMIESLESELGIRLVIRDKVHPRLSPAGQQVLPHMKKILQEYSSMIESVQSYGDAGGELTIGVLEDGVSSAVMKIVKPFMKRYPSIVVNFKTLRESEAFDAVLEKQADCAMMVHFPPAYRDLLEGDVIARSRICAVMNQEHPLAGRETVSLSEFKDDGFIIIDESQSRFGFNQTMGMCLRYGFAPHIARKAPSVSMALSAVELNYGVMILHEEMKEQAGPETVFVPLGNEPEIPVLCIRHPENQNPALIKFRDFIQTNIPQDLK